MKIEKYICPGCNKEHIEKSYDNQSEGVADIFIDRYFSIIWDKMKGKAKDLSLEEFCKEFVLISIYNYHKNRGKIRVGKSSIETSTDEV